MFRVPLGTTCGLAAASLLFSGRGLAEEPGAKTPPIHVVAIQAIDADDQAEALTKALRSALREARGWSLGNSDQSLEVLTISLKCREPLDDSCLNRVGDQLRADRYIWGVISKKQKKITGSVQLWRRNEASSRVNLEYSSSLVEPKDSALKEIAENAVNALTGGLPRGTIRIKSTQAIGEVYVNNRRLGALDTGEASFVVAAGEHEVVIKTPGYRDVSRIANLSPNGTTDLGVAPEPISGASGAADARKTLGFVGLGTGVALGAAGLFGSLKVFSIQHDDGFERYRQHSASSDICEEADLGGAPEDRHVQGLCSDASTFTILQAVAYPLAAISLGTGIYLLATSSEGKRSLKRSTESLHIIPTMAKGSGALDIRYSF